MDWADRMAHERTTVRLSWLTPESFASAFAAVAPNFLVILLLLTAAAASAVSASYLSKPTFGTCADYITLFVSGFGSSSLARIVATVLLWQRKTTG
jgi:hypothetical protein